MDHIAGELEKLSLREKYHGGEQIHAANDIGMDISHVGEAIIYTHNRNLKVKQLLHVPQATKNLVSVHRFAVGNNVFLEYHPDFFLIKDRATMKLLLRGKCRKGLYPLPSSFARQVFRVSRPSFHIWHSRFGHPAAPIV
jgi:hypothetical protein